MQNLKYLLPISGKSVFKKRLVIHYTGLNNTQSLICNSWKTALFCSKYHPCY